jgi:hypothetical protein
VERGPVNNKTRTAFFLLFICAVAALFAGGKKEKSNVVEVTGTVRLIGNEPVTELVISGSDTEWYIAREDAPKLKDLQHRTITVRGTLTVEERRLANGYLFGERRTLSNVEIVSVE